ncbi:MAG: AAA family ATPase [Armatimonadetes bacterium]|nr:AAA family ATPase [Armatimonadota bacterium]
MKPEKGLKVSVAGKGGAGKTTVAAALALALRERGFEVFAVDGDSNSCLGHALGFPDKDLANLRPLSDMREELQRRAQPEGSTMYSLTPPVDDLIEQYSLRRDGLSLLVMGTIDQGGSGCACPLNATLREVLRQMVKRPEAVVVDLEAGVEHLGRGTAMALDHMLIVTEPTEASIRTCNRIARLAADIGVRRVAVLPNKIRSPEDVRRIGEGVQSLSVLEPVPYVENAPEVLTDGSAAARKLIDILGRVAEAIEAWS